MIPPFSAERARGAIAIAVAIGSALAGAAGWFFAAGIRTASFVTRIEFEQERSDEERIRERQADFQNALTAELATLRTKVLRLEQDVRDCRFVNQR